MCCILVSNIRYITCFRSLKLFLYLCIYIFGDLYGQAYCLYRQNKLDDALDSLNDIEQDSATKLLESQILFHQGKMDASVDIYQNLPPRPKVESLEINLVAGLVSAGRVSEVQGVMDSMRVKATSSFELAYNTAFALIERNKLSDAEQLLLSART